MKRLVVLAAFLAAHVAARACPVITISTGPPFALNVQSCFDDPPTVTALTCDGHTDDTAALQALFAAGGHIRLPSGTCMFRDNLVYSDNSFIEGEGRGITILKLMDGSTIPVSATGLIGPADIALTVHKKNVSIEHLTVDGNRGHTTGTYECIVMAGTQGGSVRDVETHSCTECGVVVDAQIETTTSTMEFSQISDSYSWDNLSDGFQVGKTIITNSYAYNNLGNGIRFAGAGQTDGMPYFSIIKNNAAYGNTGVGIEIEEQVGGNITPNVVEGNFVAHNAGGIGTNIRGTRILNNIVEYNGNGTLFQRYGIWVAQDDISVQGNIIKNNSNIGIGIFNNRKNLDISGNIIFDDQATPSQAWGILGVSWSAGSNNEIAHNKTYGNPLGGIDPSLATHTDYKVRFNDNGN